MPHEDDALERWLAKPTAFDDSALRAALLGQTMRIVRRRRRVRQALMLAGLAASVALGLLAYGLWPEPAEPRIVMQDRPEVKKETAHQPPATALAQEWRAVDARNDRAAEFLKAGDRYLEEEADPESALRCYRQALDNPV